MEERTIILENISTNDISLKDSMGRRYPITAGSKIRISEMALQDIFDYRPSKVIFADGCCAVSNITKTKLYNMGLTEEEIEKYGKNLLEENTKPVKIEEINYEVVEEEKEEEVKEKEEEVKEEKSAIKPVKKQSSKKKSK